MGLLLETLISVLKLDIDLKEVDWCELNK